MNEENKSPNQVFGILSIVFAVLSFIPMVGVVSILGLIFGIIGIFKEAKNTLSIIGTVLSAAGAITSPILWALIVCSFNPEAKMCKPEETTQESFQKMNDTAKEIGKQIEQIDKNVQKSIESPK